MRNIAVNDGQRKRLAYGCQVTAAVLIWLQAVTALGSGLSDSNFQPIDQLVNREIQLGNIPGAVVLIGYQGKVVYRRPFGHRALEPQTILMTEDTIFDLASLTKVVATSTAVVQLVERGKLHLDDTMGSYWPEFGSNGKEEIRIRDLLTHSSGLRAGLKLASSWSGYREALKQIEAETLLSPAGRSFIYSDINFIVLGELVARISGLPLDLYCARRIFAPLGMKDTGFKPGLTRGERIAPTVYQNGHMLRGEVHDPTAYRMGGVSGHSGLFSTADDLALFAQMLLNGGNGNGAQILKPATIEEMTSRQQTANGGGWWGLGWEIAPLFNSNSDDLPPPNSFGHTGYTGTSIWIDPDSKSYVIILTNRVHPRGAGAVKSLRADVLRFVTASLRPSVTSQLMKHPPERTVTTSLGVIEEMTAPVARVRSGVDELMAKGFAPLAGLRVGLITNHTGIDSKGHRTVDVLFKSSQVKLAALFSPEHGLNGNVDERVPSSIEAVTQLPVHSLYGTVRRPTKEMLQGLDALVFDIQDAGARFYTYITTMAYAMEEAAKHGLSFFVLDRPNPINASAVQGPLLDAELKSFTGYFPLPVRHGMTVGELAAMLNEETKIGAKLHVIKMANYQRRAWYDETGLRWIRPSPNLRTLAAATLYPGVALVEGTNVSVGRGTESPFELVGAPWIDGKELAAYLNQRKIQGVSFNATSFRPDSNRYEKRLCYGVRIGVEDRNGLDTPALGVELASALYRLYPREFQLEKTLGLIGARWVLRAIKDGQDARIIAQDWQASLEKFRALRAKYLLYPLPSGN